MVRTISFKLLYGLVILRHARRRLVTIGVTSNPTAEWIEAFGSAYTHRIRAMGIRDHPTAPRSP